MARIVIGVPASAIGYIFAALMRAGLGKVENTKPADFVISSSEVGFEDLMLVRTGIDVSRMVAELR